MTIVADVLVDTLISVGEDELVAVAHTTHKDFYSMNVTLVLMY